MNDAEQIRALFEATFPGAVYRTAGGVGVRSEYFDAWLELAKLRASGVTDNPSCFYQDDAGSIPAGRTK